ncbi:putative phage repressor [Rhodopseudomonas palustris TIE-1]|uniref:S24 family peptidase n=1 Tax=Rhodopseudomonas palustris TaxID=1076 RepID=UPI000164A595|nr:S24 family peptidase [Rhodopseudomonas palustris]ACF01862.1 putative phage repressor [Rhodopseudomonas palustris TIE-1]
MKALIRAILDARDWTQADLAARLRTTQVTVSRWLDGTEPRGPMRDRLRDLAEESGLVPQARANHVIKIMGRVGAGAIIDPDYEQTPEDGLEQIELPYPIGSDLIGFEVSGTSMMPKYDPGEILVVQREQPVSFDSMIGQYAVVRTDDGRRLVKRVMPGPKSNLYNLESANAETIVGARLVWGSPVQMAIPNVQLRRIAMKSSRSSKAARSKKSS